MSLTERNLAFDDAEIDNAEIDNAEIDELTANDISDNEVESNIRDAFQNSPVHGLRDLAVERDGSSILISGKVNSFYQKQLAQEVVRHIHPNTQIVNSIVVE